MAVIAAQIVVNEAMSLRQWRWVHADKGIRVSVKSADKSHLYTGDNQKPFWH